MVADICPDLQRLVRNVTKQEKADLHEEAANRSGAHLAISNVVGRVLFVSHPAKTVASAFNLQSSMASGSQA